MSMRAAVDLAELAMRRIAKAGKTSPAKRFDAMVKAGLIDKEGRLGSRVRSEMAPPSSPTSRPRKAAVASRSK